MPSEPSEGWRSAGVHLWATGMANAAPSVPNTGGNLCCLASCKCFTGNRVSETLIVWLQFTGFVDPDKSTPTKIPKNWEELQAEIEAGRVCFVVFALFSRD